jgi:GAF domain-containing protein
MQINPLLKDLVEQYYGSMEALPSDMVQFLQTVNNLFASVSIESGQLPIRPASQASIDFTEAMAEEHVHLIHNLSTSLAEASSEQEIYDRLLLALSENFSFKTTRLFKFDSENDSLMPVASSSDEPIEGSTLGTIGAARAAADSRQTLFTSYDPQANLYQTQDAEIAIPLLAKGDLLGVLNIIAESKKELDPRTRVLLEMIASQTSFALISLTRPSPGKPSEPQEDRPQIDQPETEFPSDERISMPLVEAPLPQAVPTSFRDISSLKFHQYSYDPNLRTAVPVQDSAGVQLEKLPNRPLQVQGQIIGTFGVQAEEDEPLTSEERALLDSISEEVSQALERAHLFESSQRSAAELAVLNEMGNLFSEAPDEKTILDGLYTYTSKLIPAPTFYVAYYDEEDDTISFPNVVLGNELITPDHPSADNFKTRPAGTGLTGHIIKTRQPILIEDNAEEVFTKLGLPYQQFGGETQSWLGVPMTMGDQVLGVITVQADTDAGLYNQHHLDLLSTIASQAAVAINNIRLFSQEQERAEQERLVRTITDKVRRGTSTHDILQIAIEELSRVLNAEISSIQLGTPDQLIENQNGGASSPPTAPPPTSELDGDTLVDFAADKSEEDA